MQPVLLSTRLDVSRRSYLRYVHTTNYDLSPVVHLVLKGLPLSVALSLTIIARRMAARRVLVKNLATIETLGCMSVLCSDKTGTLTEGNMVSLFPSKVRRNEFLFFVRVSEGLLYLIPSTH